MKTIYNVSAQWLMHDLREPAVAPGESVGLPDDRADELLATRDWSVTDPRGRRGFIKPPAEPGEPQEQP